MSRMNEMNQALRRQSPRSQWLLELATPSVALGRGLPRNELAARPSAANVNHPGVGLLETLVRTTVRAVKHYRTAHELKQLDARLLDDIGITRDEIDNIAAEAAGQAAASKGAYAMPRFTLLTSLRNAWRRQAAIAALQRLSDHTLADIGMERGRIAMSVDALTATGDATLAPVRTVRTVKITSPTAAVPAEDAAPVHKVAA